MAVDSVFPVSSFPTPVACALDCSLDPPENCGCDITELIEDTGFDDNTYWTTNAYATLFNDPAPAIPGDETGCEFNSGNQYTSLDPGECSRASVFTIGTEYTVSIRIMAEISFCLYKNTSDGLHVYNGTQLIMDVTGDDVTEEATFTADQSGDLRIVAAGNYLCDAGPTGDCYGCLSVDDISVITCV